MKTTLFLFHPKYTESRANKAIVENILLQKNTVHVHHVDSLYPTYNISVEREQEVLCATDTIIFQFPYYWFSVPAMLKLWLDTVFTYGFAYGSEGSKLHGKNAIISVTVGGAEEVSLPYISTCLTSLRKSIEFSGMNYKELVASYGYGIQASHEHITNETKKHADGLIVLL